MKTRDRIIEAAIPVFAAKGRHGAHIEEIANTAHINKAMIYYIFHSKDELYFQVLKFVLTQAWHSFNPGTYCNLNSRQDLIDDLSRYISVEMAFFINNRDYARIMVDAMTNGAEEIPLAVSQIKESGGDVPLLFIKTVLEKGKEMGYIRDIDTDQFMLSMIGAVIVYFLTHSLSEILDIQVGDETVFLEKRKDSVIDLILNGLVTRES